jgi:hypothetical protein
MENIKQIQLKLKELKETDSTKDDVISTIYAMLEIAKEDTKSILIDFIKWYNPTLKHDGCSSFEEIVITYLNQSTSLCKCNKKHWKIELKNNRCRICELPIA